MPQISVLISVYNSEKYIGEAIESVLSQVFTDFELILINDGSTDNTEKIIKSFTDYRIKYFWQENQGVSKSLNRGLCIATGKYIAKLDADDVCYAHRLDVQYKFMQNNPDYVVCGSYTDVIDENGEFVYTFRDIPSLNEEIQDRMGNINCIVHSSSFYRLDHAQAIGGYYEPIKQHFEDYMFFSQLIKSGKAYNIPEPLVKYRLTPGSISTRHKNNKYSLLVKNVIHRGYITEEEKKFLFAYTGDKSKGSTQISNHYLTLSRLMLIHQFKTKKSIKLYFKAIKANPFNSYIVISGVYMVIIFLRIISKWRPNTKTYV